MKTKIVQFIILLVLLCSGYNLHASGEIENVCAISHEITPTLPFESSEVSRRIIDLYEENRAIWTPQDLRLIGGCYVAQKEYGKALKVYQNLLRQDGTNALLITSIGEIHQLNEDLDNAELMYAKSWNNFHDPVALSLWGWLKLSTSGAQSLSPLLPDLIKHQREYADIREILLSYVLMTENIESAKDVFLSVVRSVKGHEVKQSVKLTEMFVFATARLEKEVKSHVGAEERKLENKNWGMDDEVIAIDQSSRQKDSISVVQDQPSSFSFENSVVNKAIIELYEKNPKIWYPKDIKFIGYCYVSEKEYEKALVLWHERLRLDPSNVSLVIGMGGLYQLNGDFINAESMYAKGWNELHDPSALSQLAILKLRTDGVLGLTPLLPALIQYQRQNVYIQRVLFAYCLMTEDMESAKEVYNLVKKNLTEESTQDNKELSEILEHINSRLKDAPELHEGNE